MDHHDLKIEFAKHMLHTQNDSFRAAFLTSSDTGFALQIGRDWKTDPVVIAEIDRLLSSGDAKSFLPTKELQAQDIYTLATNERVAVEDRLKAHRLYAELMGFIEKPTQGGVNILNQGVMIVKDHGTDAAWEAKAREQQRTLIGHASGSN